ncbi:MAG: permease [Candidatus Omnitrophota bacterium]|nr:permease [Candidatus Omnitrophota bacterium]
MQNFIHIFLYYLREVLPALAIGFLISGFVHELIPEDKVLKYLGSGGIKPIFYSTLIGTLLPVCCWGSLPIAVSFYKKGARLGPVLAFLVATPATSISALFVAYSVLGLGFTTYIFFAVISMGLFIGLAGNTI